VGLAVVKATSVRGGRPSRVLRRHADGEASSRWAIRCTSPPGVFAEVLLEPHLVFGYRRLDHQSHPGQAFLPDDVRGGTHSAGVTMVTPCRASVSAYWRLSNPCRRSGCSSRGLWVSSRIGPLLLLVGGDQRVADGHAGRVGGQDRGACPHAYSVSRRSSQRRQCRRIRCGSHSRRSWRHR